MCVEDTVILNKKKRYISNKYAKSVYIYTNNINYSYSFNILQKTIKIHRSNFLIAIERRRFEIHKLL